MFESERERKRRRMQAIVIETVAAHRLKKMKELLTFEKLATWTKLHVVIFYGATHADVSFRHRVTYSKPPQIELHGRSLKHVHPFAHNFYSTRVRTCVHTSHCFACRVQSSTVRGRKNGQTAGVRLMASTTCHKIWKTVSLATPKSTATSMYEAPAIIRKAIARRVSTATAPLRLRNPVHAFSSVRGAHTNNMSG